MNFEIRQGDCLERMREMDSGSIDLIFADYPFNSQDGKKDYHSFVEATSREFYRLLAEGGNLVVVNNPSNIFKHARFFQDFTLRQGIALLRKGAFYPAFHWGFAHNYALILTKGDTKKKWNGNRVNNARFDKDFIEYQNGFRSWAGWHPQAMPLALVEKWVGILSDEGDAVLDPFAGAGTTVLACVRTRRKGIGIEFRPEYCKLIEDRIACELARQQQQRLFEHEEITEIASDVATGTVTFCFEGEEDDLYGTTEKILNAVETSHPEIFYRCSVSEDICGPEIGE